jgi:hypothetical protein
VPRTKDRGPWTVGLLPVTSHTSGDAQNTKEGCRAEAGSDLGVQVAPSFVVTRTSPVTEVAVFLTSTAISQDVRFEHETPATKNFVDGEDRALHVAPALAVRITSDSVGLRKPSATQRLAVGQEIV